MRLFISIDIPDDIKNRINEMISKLQMKLTPVKWVEKKNLHLTLKFLGEVDEGRISDLTDIIGRATEGFGPFTIKLAGMGLFPSPARPRVIWVGMTEGSERMRTLADGLESTVSKEGYRGEEKEFTPHLAIGRVKEKIDVGPLKDFMGEHCDSVFGSFNVDHVLLVKSTLKPCGPIYEEIKKISL